MSTENKSTSEPNVDDIAVEATEQVQSQEAKSALSPLDTLAAAVEHVRRERSEPIPVPCTLTVLDGHTGRVKQRLEAYGAACRNSPRTLDLELAQSQHYAGRSNSPDPDAVMENIREAVAKSREEQEVSGNT